MRAQEITFLKLVQGQKQFQVPLYQRTYSWRQKHLARLWEDVSELVDQHLAGDQPAGTLPRLRGPGPRPPPGRMASSAGWWSTDSSGSPP